jgi:uncharacterized protein (DUF952 family)
MERLFHIARVADWEQAQRHGVYRVSSLGTLLDDVGFIHLSFANQVKPVADAVYRGMTDLVLLELDPQRLDAPVVLSRCTPTFTARSSSRRWRWSVHTSHGRMEPSTPSHDGTKSVVRRSSAACRPCP